MRMPQSPPPTAELLSEFASRPDWLLRAIDGGLGHAQHERYLHWDKLRRLSPPKGFTNREWWLALKINRGLSLKPLPLKDKRGKQFCYCLPDPAPQRLHEIDQNAGGSLACAEVITNPHTRDRYVLSSLIEEAIRSSQLEGAATTRQIAKEMIRTGRPPRDKSEQMILNNFRAMDRIRGLRDQELTPELVFELHGLLARSTLDDPAAAGRFRTAEDRVCVVDSYDEVFHTPPPAEELPARLRSMCDFANGKAAEAFLHPVIRAIVLHFWLAYDHPFVDGNGRCARALFYWCMLRHNYWLAEYLSISQVIRKGPMKYYRAFLYTETDDNDLTYFILYHLEIMQKAVDELNAYLQRKVSEVQEVEGLLRISGGLNHRQRALLSHALRHPGARYSVESHRNSHGVVYETARSDLLALVEQGLLVCGKIGRTWEFQPSDKLAERLKGAVD